MRTKSVIGMKIQFKNLGAVGFGAIDLGRRINLLCGPNGTGKTYASIAVYTLLCRKIIFNEKADYVERLTREWSATIDVPQDRLIMYRSILLNEWGKNLAQAYGIGAKDATSIFGRLSICFEESEEEFMAEVRRKAIQRKVTVQGVNVAISKAKDSDKLTLTILDRGIPDESIEGMRLLMNSVICHTLMMSPIGDLIMLPVERNSIYTFSKELSLTRQMTIDQVQAIAEKGSKNVKLMDIITKNSNRYPLPITHRIKEANDLAEVKKQTGEFAALAEKIENELLHGKVEISDEGEIKFRSDKIATKVLPIVATASIVKTLSSLVVYLKHQAQKEDLIIIDEPEINLHPDSQIVLTRILARLANKGLRLMVSTHSDYIIREMNNLIMMSNKTNPTVMGLLGTEYANDEYIAPEDIDVRFFGYKTKTSRKATIEKLPVDHQGFDVEEINRIIDHQNNISGTLFYALEND